MLEEKVLKTIKKYGMLNKGDKVVVGVSGGPDSVTLIHALVSLAGELDLYLYIAHLNHMLRPVEAEKDVRFVRELATKLGLPVFIKHENVPEYVKLKKVSVEAGAREVRYAFLREVSANMKANKIALGHTMDDQAETLLINLFRGSGRTGLGGIMPVNKEVIRPIIECSRQEIMAYLEENKFRYCTDTSNLEPIYQRNKIRLELLPQIADDYNTNIIETLYRTSLILQEEDLYLESLSLKNAQHILRQGRGSEVLLNLKEFERIPQALKPRVLREAVKRVKGDLLQLSFVHISDLMDLAENKTTGQSVSLPGEIVAHRQYGNIRFFKGKYVPEKIQAGRKDEYIIRKSIFERKKHPSTYRATDEFAYFDAARVAFPLYIRTRREGDRFHPHGISGQKKLTDFMIDQKIPQEARNKVPLLISKGKIMWVIGYRVSDEAKIVPETKRVMKVAIYRKI